MMWHHLVSVLGNHSQKSADSCWLPENRVILFGFPPNDAMLSLIHFIAMRWSRRPWLPRMSSCPRYRKPNDPNLIKTSCISLVFWQRIKVKLSFSFYLNVKLHFIRLCLRLFLTSILTIKEISRYNRGILNHIISFIKLHVEPSKISHYKYLLINIHKF
jgi:hypothetical protein